MIIYTVRTLNKQIAHNCHKNNDDNVYDIFFPSHVFSLLSSTLKSILTE